MSYWHMVNYFSRKEKTDNDNVVADLPQYIYLGVIPSPVLDIYENICQIQATKPQGQPMTTSEVLASVEKYAGTLETSVAQHVRAFGSWLIAEEQKTEAAIAHLFGAGYTVSKDGVNVTPAQAPVTLPAVA